MRFYLFSLFILLNLCASTGSQAQNKELRLNLNDSGTNYLRLTFTAQIWARYTENNPGSTVFNDPVNEDFDIGLRRVRSQFYGKIHEKVFFYTQVGINNFNSISARRPPIYFHDVAAEYYLTPRSLHMGMGLSAWTGFARFASPAVASIMGYDAPLAEQATNDANDQFLRKLSVYAKGKLGKFDYRLILSDPMAVSNSTVVGGISTSSEFSRKDPELQGSGYFMWQFLEEESNLTPYMSGSYYGKKKIFNIGAGFQYQPKAMWHWNNILERDTVYEDLMNYAVDLYFDHPLKKGAAISAYAVYINFGFGKNYLRNLGVMNTANGVVAGTDNLNGTGNGFPMIGSGQLLQAQIGYLFPPLKNSTAIMPYAMLMLADYDGLEEQMFQYDIGLNYLIDGNRAKLSLNYQNRPVFNLSERKESERKNMLLLQFQIAI